MSRFIAIIGNQNGELKKKAQDLLPGARFFSSGQGNFFLVASGYGKTTFAGNRELDGQEFFWAACGQGIAHKSGKPYFMEHDDWNKYIFDDTFNKKISGHFVCMKANDSFAEVINDELGNSEFYVFVENDYVVISTELHLLARLIKSPELNYQALSTRWILENQITSDSPVKNINRYSAGSKVIISFSEGRPIIIGESHLWSPVIKENISSDKVIEILSKFTTFVVSAGGSLKLGLSGGLDSRLLLAVLYGKAGREFTAFTFGDPRLPDRKISAEIAEKLNIELINYDDNIIFSTDELNNIEKFVAITQGTAPVSEYFMKRNYFDVASDGQVIIDGGFGEILRRGLFNKLKYRGQKFIKDKNSPAFNEIIRLDRCPFFTEEFERYLRNEAITQTDKMFETMPEFNNNIDYWLDLLSIRTKMTNYCNFEQVRTDEFCISYTPFSQPELLNAVFSLDNKYKINSILVNKIIKTNCPVLTTIPLAKGTTTVPFGYPTYLQKGMIKLKKILKMNGADTLSARFLMSYKEFVYDRLKSARVRNEAIYDYRKLASDIDAFYAGNHNLASGIDRWLTLDIFMSSLKSS